MILVVTNKYLVLPLFFCIMLVIFYLSFNVVCAFLSDLLAAISAVKRELAGGPQA